MGRHPGRRSSSGSRRAPRRRRPYSPPASTESMLDVGRSPRPMASRARSSSSCRPTATSASPRHRAAQRARPRGSSACPSARLARALDSIDDRRTRTRPGTGSAGRAASTIPERAVGARAHRRRGRRQAVRHRARARVVAVEANPADDHLARAGLSGALHPHRVCRASTGDGPKVDLVDAARRASCDVESVKPRRVRIDVFTIFPALRRRLLPGRACSAGPAGRASSTSACHDLRDVRHRRPPHASTTTPFGGRRRAWCCAPEPVFASVEAVAPPPPALPARSGRSPLRPGDGPPRWPAASGFSLLCGRYEGVDHRIRAHLVADC